MFWLVNESTVMRFLKLIGCQNDKVGRCAALVRERNNSAHANGNIFYNNAKSLGKKIDQVLGVLADLESHTRPVIERLYLRFLKESQDPEERAYEDEADQIREALVHENYFSRKDVDVCLRHDITPLAREPRYDNIEALHAALWTYAGSVGVAALTVGAEALAAETIFTAEHGR